MITAILFMLLFAISGICISEVVFTKQSFHIRIWLGLALGLLLLTWLPSLFAFAFGFTLLAQLFAAVTSLLCIAVSVIVFLLRRKQGRTNSYSIGQKWMVLLWTAPILILFFSLLNTHILYKHVDGSLWVGQVTYGDLAMHLGFITGIAEQGIFPPQYSIFPGHALNYPFLCETSGASLFQLGATARQAYILSAGYAFVLVLYGVYNFFAQWLKKPSRAVLATILFFFGGGFGFFYFFDLSKSGGLLPALLGTYGQTASQTLLEGFYQTPTNIPALGLRWVNPIVDMLIPQRATLFGWAFLFPCLYLLHGLAFEKKNENAVPLAIIAGLLPMIHTHSFLALGVISAVYCLTDLISVRFERKRILAWGIYAILACAIAAPQLFLFTFKQASESSLVRFHLNWANEGDSYLWFYIKNMGFLFLLMPIAFLVLPKRDKKIYAGAIFLWILAELVEFQPNDYDNNKLLFIWHAFTCGLVAKFLSVARGRILFLVRKRSDEESRTQPFSVCVQVLLAAVLGYYLFKWIRPSEDVHLMRQGTAFTLFFTYGLLLWLCVESLCTAKRKYQQVLRVGFPMLLSIWQMIAIARVWNVQYQNTEYVWNESNHVFVVLLCVAGLAAFLFQRIYDRTQDKVRPKFIGTPAAISAASFVLMFALLASSAMTILRELKSEYQVYTKDEAVLTEQIRSATEPDAVVLANSYHWNLITPLTGRSIVTGTGTFLYYHGIDTTERELDVALMFEAPEENSELFQKYGVRYVLISNAERWNYDIDYSFLRSHGTVVAQNDAGMLYRLNP